MKGLITAILFGHGIAHLVGFLGPWRLIDLEHVTFQNRLAGGLIHASDGTLRALGEVWLLLALGFLTAGAGISFDWPWAPRAVSIAGAASLAMCLLAWPAARIGVFVNLAILGSFAVAASRGWLG